MLEDGVLTEEESNYILSVFNEIVHPIYEYPISFISKFTNGKIKNT